MPGKESISKKVNACVTCDMWRGELRRPSDDRKEIIFETMQRGTCSGPLETGKAKTPMSKCRAWRLWKKINKPRVDSEAYYGGSNKEEEDPSTKSTIGFRYR